MTKLCLGTVQFGMKYGVNNQIGRQPTREESFEMLDYALTNGIEVIDTARAYGDAELILGEYFKSNKLPSNLKVISKLRPNIIDADEKDIQGVVMREIEDSLNRMHIDRLDGYLLHTPEYIYNQKILEALVKAKETKHVSNIGVSIYNLKEGYAAIESGIVDYIQLPYSILDQRGTKDGFIKEAKKAGITIFTRSAFLQGLFMMDYETIPEYLKNAIPYLQKIDRIIEKYNVDKIDAILSFVCAEKDIDYLVFGVEKLQQLKINIYKYNNMLMPTECVNELKKYIDNVDESIIFPSLWSNGRIAE